MRPPTRSSACDVVARSSSLRRASVLGRTPSWGRVLGRVAPPDRGAPREQAFPRARASLLGWARVTCLLAALCTSPALTGCGCEDGPSPPERTEPTEPPAPPRLTSAPRVLDLAEGTPEESVRLDEARPVAGAPVFAPPAQGRRCPADMVDVAGQFCIDRYEVSLVDAAQGRRLSPHYPPVRGRIQQLYESWQQRQARATTELGRLLAIPAPPRFQLEEPFVPRAVSERGAIPNGYLSRDTAERACQSAGKRLCRRDEWVRACRGDQDMKFPYGPSYRAGVCNVHRDAHPAALLHGSASINHLDPRLPLVQAHDGPLLRPAGATPGCASRWGEDAIFDMVGNLDEWIDDESGVFLGGFYSRANREGCDASISSHAPSYLDYSLGTRCCRDPGLP